MFSAPSVISACAGHNALKLRKDGVLPTHFSHRRYCYFVSQRLVGTRVARPLLGAKRTLRPSCSRVMRRDGSRRISPSCRNCRGDQSLKIKGDATVRDQVASHHWTSHPRAKRPVGSANPLTPLPQQALDLDQLGPPHG